MNNKLGTTGIFTDVGANIGACTMLMALHDANIIAFEPMTPNFHVMMKSMEANPKLQHRIKLYPYGLGEVSNVSFEAYGEPGNFGNSVIGVVVTDWNNARHEDWMKKNPFTVKVYKMDDLIALQSYVPLITLMKIDVQGYEVKVLRGATKVFRSGQVKLIQLELSRKHLAAQGTSPSEYCQLLADFGYILYTEEQFDIFMQYHGHNNNTHEHEKLLKTMNESRPIAPAACDEVALHGIAVDILAVWKDILVL